MKEKIYSEMLTHIPTCTHKDPKNILLLSKNSISFINEIAKYKTIETKVAEDIDTLRDLEDNSFDIVISEFDADSITTAHINRVLKDDGLAVFNNFKLDDVEQTKQKLTEIGKYFKIVMPYSLLGHTKAVLASKEYHPTADIILQRADLTDGFEVYNSDLHVGVFAMPTYIKKRYLGIVKN
jgi:spermidine synthase